MRQRVRSAEYAALVTIALPGLAIPLLEAYPCNIFDPNAGYEQLVAVLTDAFFTCSSRRMLRAAAASQTEPVYRYLFTHPVAYHGVDVYYVFNAFDTSSYSPTPAEITLSHQMQSYWVNFAATGNPNGAGLPHWDAYDPGADNALALDTPIGGISGFGAVGCGVWDSVQSH
jgi:para-nitrobenzyl esterase